MKKKIQQAVPTRASIDTMRVSDRMESRREPAYSTFRLNAGAFTGIKAMFFSVAQGGAVGDVDTNIVTPGMLPFPQKLTVDSLRLDITISDPIDWTFLPRLFKTTSIRFFVGNKDYHTVPLSLVAGGLSGLFAGGQYDGAKAKVLSQFGCASKDGYKFALKKSVTIGSKENFGVDLQSTLAYTLNSSVTLRMYLEGTKYVDVR